MRIIFRKSIYCLFLLFIIAGCIPQKQTRYLQNVKNSKENYQPNSILTEKYILLPNDYLFIYVSTPDPKISEFFNQGSSSSSMGSVQGNTRFFYYQIDDNFEIDFPFAGKIKLQNCNMTMAKTKIQEALIPYLKEANINIKLANTTFTVLGEVRQPGVKNMGKDQITIFEAIAQAGDVTPYAKRKDVVVVRQTIKGEETISIDLTDKKIVNSSVYYVYPNDLIYIRSMKAKNWGIGESFSFGMISTLLALTFTIASIVK